MVGERQGDKRPDAVFPYTTFFEAREAVFVAADAAVVLAVDAAGEADFAVLLEHRRIVEAGAAGDEAAACVVRGPLRAAVGVEAGGDHLEAGAVFLRLDLEEIGRATV